MPKLNPNPQNLAPSLSLYQLDYLQWIERTISHLQHQNYDQVEWEHLIEEIQDMGRSERREIFPIQCLYSLPELLSDDFLPVAVSESIEDMD
jgi:hypothetical protein